MTSERSRTMPFVPLVGGIVSVVAGIAVVVFLVNQLSGSDQFDDPPGSVATTTPTPESQQGSEPKDVLSAGGLGALLREIEEATGTTQVFDATLYPAYAVLQLPVDRETLRQQSYYWDGRTLKAQESFGKSTSPRVDLASIEPAAILRLVNQARRQVDEPNSWYVIINAPDANDEAVMYAYASNKYTEGGYISAKADGTVVRRVTW